MVGKTGKKSKNFLPITPYKTIEKYSYVSIRSYTLHPFTDFLRAN